MKRAAFLMLFLLSFPCHVTAAKAPRVEVFSPEGTVKNVRQVAARFSEPMTTFGDPRNASPFDIACPEKGSGRWTDVREWVYDFDRDLPAGVSCSFTLRGGLRTLAGAAVGGDRTFSFSTGGPALMRSDPHEDGTIDEDQAFILDLDAEPEEKSVLSAVRFAVEGLKDTIGVTLVKGAERTTLLKATQMEDTPDILILRCRQSFPNKAKVKLILGRGVASRSGVATSADQVLSFQVRDRFKVTFSCQRLGPKAPCLPMLPMNLSFSSPVPAEAARQIVMKNGRKVYQATFGDDEEVKTEEKRGATVRGVQFTGPFPERSALTIELPKGLVDDAGRRPANKNFPLQVKTDGYPPLAKFASPFGIVELTRDAALPVTLRDVEPQVAARQLKMEGPEGQASIKGKVTKVPADREAAIIQWLRTVKGARRYKPVLKNAPAEKIAIAKPNGDKAFEVVGIPLKKPGFHVVELESPRLGAALLGRRKPMYVSSAALVTNMSAHLKRGRESSLVWVTSLDKGEPVADAVVTIRDCGGKSLWHGKTDPNGIAKIDAKLTEHPRFCREPKDKEKEQDYFYDNEGAELAGMSGGLFAFARKGDDLTFVHSSWDKGIEGWRFQLPSEYSKEHTVAHTVFDRSLLRAGEKVHMKHFIRYRTMNGFDLRKAGNLPKSAVIVHRGSGQHYELPLQWNADNTAESTLAIPKDADLGFYDVHLQKKESGKSRRKTVAGVYEEGDEEYRDVDGWNSGFFRVEEFRVPLMKGIIEGPKEPAVNKSSVEVDLYVSHLSGGGAAGAPVKLRTRTARRSVSFDGYEGYAFANGKVEPGLLREDESVRVPDEDEEDVGIAKQATYRTQELVLDKAGALRATVPDLPRVDAPQAVLAELEFRDPNGEVQTVSGQVPLWPSKLLVGVQPDGWSVSQDDLKFKALVLDLDGKPVPRAKVKVELLNRTRYSHRKRLVGGFYSYEHVTETQSLGKICDGSTDAAGLLSCSVTSPVSGNVILQATVTDDAGNTSSANQDLWVAGKGEWWFDVSDSDRIDLIPEKRAYDPGETATFQVRMPFRAATVLVTVEREGILESFVKKVSGTEPVITVPVKGNYAPNVFVSALCVRGRVDGTAPTALFDAGKPTYRLGISEISVGRMAHELKVRVTPDKESYAVRGKARVKIVVAAADGAALPKGAEVALAAVDEGLLELMPNQSWRLLEAMMGRRGYEVMTATAQTQVVGRRHFGLKALPAGGSGGMRSARELFDTLLAWKGRVKLDDHGEAEVEVPLNDSLTAFTIVAVASAGSGRFGTGRATIRTTQDLMLLSGLPALVREGDHFAAGFTIRNASKRQMSLSVTARPSWAKAGAGFDPVALKLEPGEAKEVSWQAQVPTGISSATWEAAVQEENGAAADRLKVTQKVTTALPVRVYQAGVTQVEKSFDVQVQPPADAVNGRGGINVALRSRLTEGLGGVTRYMKEYPYICMEQMVSKAVALKDDKLWRHVLEVMPAHLDETGLVKYFPSPWLKGSPVLTAYLLAIANEYGRELPEDLVTPMEKSLIDFVTGKLRSDTSYRTADLALQKLTALEALSRYAPINAQAMSSITIEPNLWPTSAVLDWLNILKRSKALPNRQKLMEEAKNIIRSRLHFQGSIMNFSTESADRLWWLMVSTDTNALRTVLTFLDDPQWRVDMPRLVRGAMARQQRGSWETTIANAWGVAAMDKFSAKFESAPVTGTTKVGLAGTVKSADWAKAGKGAKLSFPWPDGSAFLSMRHQGGGKPWASYVSTAAIPLKEPLSSGYRIVKTATPVEQRTKGKWSRGDVARVRLEIEAQSDMTWVAVNDPVPAGSTILGSGLGRDSALLTEGERGKRSWPVFEERAFEGYRAYYDYVPKGKFVTEYSVRLNNAGKFRLPATRVEALYAPEMFGEIPNQAVEVE